MKGLSEEQRAAVEEFVAAFVAYSHAEAQLTHVREKLIGPAARVRRLRVPTLPIARALLQALGRPVDRASVRSLRASLRTRLTRTARTSPT